MQVIRSAAGFPVPVGVRDDQAAYRPMLRGHRQLSADESIECLMSHLRSTEPPASRWLSIAVFGLALVPALLLALACLL